MDIEFVRKALGDVGLLGALLLAVGIVVFGGESRRQGVGAVALATGGLLVAVGLMSGFLRAMGMEFEDLQ